MIRKLIFYILCVSILFCTPVLVSGEEGKTAVLDAKDLLIISGVIKNAHGKPVKDTSLEFLLNGKVIEIKEEITTSDSGGYEAEISFPAGTIPGSQIEVIAKKSSYKTERVILDDIARRGTDEKGNMVYLANHRLVFFRAISPAFWIASIILLSVYVFIAFELMHRTVAAMLGAALLLFITYTAGTFYPDYFILSFESAIRAIDMNVIFLLMAMMIIVGIMKKTGVFQWMAYKAYQIARGNVFVLSGLLMFITAVTSAFLDNVTTMLLIIPVTIEIAITLKINPVAFLLPEVFASNVGGTSTLIGDPPNIMIGSYAGLTFLDFVKNLAVICVICLAVTIIYYFYWYKKDYLKAKVDDVEKMISYLRDEYKITNKKLLTYCGFMLGFTIFLFIIHGALHMEPSIAALTGAMILVAITKTNIVEVLEKEIEWPTLIFFMGLFMVVAGAEETGLIQIIADWVKDISGGSLVVATLMILWVSAIASAIIDNIPFTATMLPITAYLTKVIPGAESNVLWWALALGACLGGNGTMIGASANVVTVGMAERAGYPISFMYYIKAAAIPMIITIILCSGWLLLIEI
ncbi:MAG: ArsB/NhaD family transporter [Nitrospira sp.]|nr:ArsB/NhaD family transporter [Nitrospira sp.]